MMRLHPGTIALQRYATGDISAGRRAAIAGHLLRCERCRAELQLLNDVREQLAGSPDPALPSDAWARIRERVAGAESLILPVSDVAPAASGRRRMAAAAAVLLVAAAAFFALVPKAGAQKSELRFEPAAPRPGDSVSVTYIPGAMFAGDSVLMLRARFRTAYAGPYDPARVLRVASLERGRDDAYHGRFRLPDSAVFALVVVEDSAAAHIDTNQQRGWEILVHDASGRPLYEALDQRKEDLSGRNWEAAYQTQRELTRLYPERVASWSGLRTYEDWVLGTAAADSLKASHLARMHGFDRRFRALARPDADQEAETMWYAMGLGDSATFRYWRGRLLREYPAHPLAVQERVLDQWRDWRRTHDNRAALQSAEALWQQYGGRSPGRPNRDAFQAQFGGFAADQAGDPAAILRWADRYVQSQPGSAHGVAAQLTGIPALREEGLRRLRAELARVERHDDADRKLFATREEHLASDRWVAAGIHADIGRALLAAGRTRAALDTLALAVAARWDAALFASVADARLAAGDTAGAVDLWARAAADPLTRPARIDSARARLGRAAAGPAWDSLVATARGDMRRRTLDGSRMKTLSEPIRLLDARGETVALKDVLGGRVGLVVFWSRFCGPAIDELPNLDRLAQDLARRGASTILLTDEKPSPELAAFLRQRKVHIPVYSDSRREAQRSIGSWGTPDLYVLDAAGRMRFHERPLENIPREVEALQEEARADRTTAAR